MFGYFNLQLTEYIRNVLGRSDILPGGDQFNLILLKNMSMMIGLANPSLILIHLAAEIRSIVSLVPPGWKKIQVE